MPTLGAWKVGATGDCFCNSQLDGTWLCDLEILMRAFVPKAFYRAPPKKGASKQEWEEWFKADDRAARNHKARFKVTAQSIEETPEEDTTKIDGVWRQEPHIK
jgi:hypothetical protein